MARPAAKATTPTSVRGRSREGSSALDATRVGRIDQSLPTWNARVIRCGTAAGGTRAFTLIELLVVLLIMGLFVGLVSTIVRPDDRGLLRVEAERLAQLLDLAAMQARLTGKAIAWTADGTGYRFWRFSEDTYWSEILDEDSLRARTLPQGMVIAGMRVENMRSPEHLRLEFNPYGATSSFSIEMTLGSARCTVAGSPIGDVRVLPEPGKGNDGLARR
jgi:general secretion pathway protein H